MGMNSFDILSAKIQQGLLENQFHDSMPALLAISTDLISIYIDEDIEIIGTCKMEDCHCNYKKKCANCSDNETCNNEPQIMWIYDETHKKIFSKPKELDSRLQLHGKRVSANIKKQCYNEMKKRDSSYGVRCELISELLVLCTVRESWEMDKCTCKAECYESVLPYIFFFNMDIFEEAVNAILEDKVESHVIQKAIRKCFKLLYLLNKNFKKADWMDVYSGLNDMKDLALAMNSDTKDESKNTEEKFYVLREIGLKNLSEIHRWKNYSRLIGVDGIKLLGVKEYVKFKRIA